MGSTANCGNCFPFERDPAGDISPIDIELEHLYHVEFIVG
jgi:hypothetical protein